MFSGTKIFSLVLLAYLGNAITSSLVSSFMPDYDSYSTIPELTLSALYKNASLPTYGINIKSFENTMIYLSSL